MDAKHTHLNMIQGVINRLSNNSFLLKGWSVVLVSGLLALGAKEAKPVYIFIAYFPATLFWLLDGYFLWQERLFRSLYDVVRLVDMDAVDYSMDTKAVRSQTPSWGKTLVSKTLITFHGAVVATIAAAMMVLFNI
jgi:hypothetical protein